MAPQNKLKNIYRNTKISGTQKGTICDALHPITIDQACKEAGKYNTYWGGKTANWNWPRKDGICRQGYQGY